MPLHRSGPGPAITGPLWIKSSRDATPRLGGLTPILFTNAADLTTNDTNNLSYGSAGDNVTVDADRQPFVALVPGGIVGWTAALNKTLATAGSTARVVVFNNGVSLTGTLASSAFSVAGGKVITKGPVSNLTSFVVTAGQTLSGHLVVSNHTLGAVNNIALTVFVA